MKTIIPLIFAVPLLAVSSNTLAGSDSGLYIGASVGQAQLDFDDELPDPGNVDVDIDFDDDDTAFKIFAGYNFGLIPLVDLAVEGAYVDFGKFNGRVGTFNNSELEVDGWTAAGLAGFKLGPVGVFGKVGFINWDGDADNFGGDDGTDPLYGIGARFTLMSFQVRAEYERYDLDNIDIDYFSVGGAITF
ncbi:porin family protein [Marinobacter panjinensis]|uniref:Porin family protein n=1 Tax=Marinobacter panjinensis TaxID=2576384 RepID=A0A4U6R577_9GAMM|nr:outer membrane beta-barrel protein [Marinobacter panjinensis]MCR8913314.1 porin family protein [Marinobacter panjinensis]TKV68012.1 porin family protein [Marinobacter panjinensis]